MHIFCYLLAALPELSTLSCSQTKQLRSLSSILNSSPREKATPGRFIGITGGLLLRQQSG